MRYSFLKQSRFGSGLNKERGRHHKYITGSEAHAIHQDKGYEKRTLSLGAKNMRSWLEQSRLKRRGIEKEMEGVHEDDSFNKFGYEVGKRDRI